jgi:hypothetical protein
VLPCCNTENENVNGEMSIPIEHLIHYDWFEYKAIEPDMNFKIKIVLASVEGKFPEINLLSDK